jgi:hypothetical protein
VRSRAETTLTDTIGDGVVAGVLAGALSGAPSTVHAAISGRSLLGSTRAIADVLGLEDAAPLVRLAVGVTVHGVLSLGWAVVAARALPRRRTVVVGVLSGVVVGVVDLAIGRRRVAALRDLPLGPQLADHAAFGAIAGAVIARRRSGRQRADRNDSSHGHHPGWSSVHATTPQSSSGVGSSSHELR